MPILKLPIDFAFGANELLIALRILMVGADSALVFALPRRGVRR